MGYIASLYNFGVGALQSSMPSSSRNTGKAPMGEREIVDDDDDEASGSEYDDDDEGDDDGDATEEDSV